MHNNFLERASSILKKPNYIHLQRYIPEMLYVHPIAVNECSCIVGERSRFCFNVYVSLFIIIIVRILMQLVSSHYDIVNGKYELRLIEEDIVSSYIAGKWKIHDCKESLQQMFHFKPPISTGARKLGDPTE